MSAFTLYFQLGFEHITDLSGADHLLFLLALCAAWEVAQWKRLLVLVTAFTVGHSVTLALAITGVIGFRPEVIEFLIPLTIFLTAALNLLVARQKLGVHYALAAGFGLIHGMGFSSYLRMMLEGVSDSIVAPLLAFNIGLEVGQLLIVTGIMLVAGLAQKKAGLPMQYWRVGLSVVTGSWAVKLMIDTAFW